MTSDKQWAREDGRGQGGGSEVVFGEALNRRAIKSHLCVIFLVRRSHSAGYPPSMRFSGQCAAVTANQASHLEKICNEAKASN